MASLFFTVVKFYKVPTLINLNKRINLLIQSRIFIHNNISVKVNVRCDKKWKKKPLILLSNIKGFYKRPYTLNNFYRVVSILPDMLS